MTHSIRLYQRPHHVPIIGVILEVGGDQVQVYSTGSVRLWDREGKFWTACHDMTEDEMAGFRVQAREILAEIPEDGIEIENNF